jgi:hypothetical protein
LYKDQLLAMLDTIRECCQDSCWRNKEAMSDTLIGLFDYLETVPAEAIQQCLGPYIELHDAPWPGRSDDYWKARGEGT